MTLGRSGRRFRHAWATIGAVCAVLIAAGACSYDVDQPRVWGASLANDSDATYLVTVNQGSSAMAVPPHSRVDLGGAGVGGTKDLTIYSTDCREAGVVVLSGEEPQAYIDPAGAVRALASDEAGPFNDRIGYAGTVFGFTCAEAGWQVVVRNDLRTEVRLRRTETPQDSWLRIGPEGRAPLASSDGDPFPDDLQVDVYSAGCQLLGTVRPTPDENVVYVSGSGVSLLGLDDFWAGLTPANLTGRNTSSACAGPTESAGIP